jgi:uncharacterized protein
VFGSIISAMNKFLFFGIFALTIFLFDLYAYQALKTISRDFELTTKRTIYWSYWIISVFFILLICFRPVIQLEKIGGASLNLIQAFGVILFLGKFLIAIPLFVEDIFRLFDWVYRLLASNFNQNQDHVNVVVSRRKFISYSGLSLAFATISMMTYGIAKGAHQYRTRRVKLKFKDLPESFDGFRIVQISDIHSGSFWDRKAVERGVEKIKKLKADLVVFTGDLVNNEATEMESWKNLFSGITSPNGVYSVLGNHDYGDYHQWPSIEAKAQNLEYLKQVQKEMGWQLLMNETVFIEKDGQKIALSGVENWSAKGQFKKYGDLNKAISEHDKNQFHILLSHDPSHWKAEVIKAFPQIKLMLAGHTHGFQFGIETHGWKWSPVKYVYKEWAGLYREAEQYLYVNRGFGYIGYPGRLGIQPEITEITLEKA